MSTGDMLRFAITLIAWTLVERATGLDWQNEVNVSMCNWAQFRGRCLNLMMKWKED